MPQYNKDTRMLKEAYSRIYQENITLHEGDMSNPNYYFAAVRKGARPEKNLMGFDIDPDNWDSVDEKGGTVVSIVAEWEYKNAPLKLNTKPVIKPTRFSQLLDGHAKKTMEIIENIEAKLLSEFDGEFVERGSGYGFSSLEIRFADAETAATAEKFINSMLPRLQGIDVEVTQYDVYSNLPEDHPLYYDPEQL